MSSSRFLFPEAKLYSMFSYYRVGCHRCKFSFCFIDPTAGYNSTPEVRQHIGITCPNCQHPPCLKCKIPMKQNGIELAPPNMTLPVFRHVDENGVPDEEAVWPWLCNSCGELQPLQDVSGDKVTFKNAVCCFCRTKANYETLCWREESQIPPPEEPKTPITLQSVVGRARSTSQTIASRARSASAAAKSVLGSAVAAGKSAAHDIKDKVETQVQRKRGESFKLNSVQHVEANPVRDYALQVTEKAAIGPETIGDARRAAPTIVQAPVIAPGLSAPVMSMAQPHPQCLMPGRPSRFSEQGKEYEYEGQGKSNFF